MSFGKTKRSTRLGLAVLAALTVGSVQAYAHDRDDDDHHGPRPLNGDYGFTMTQSCVRTPFQVPPASGFNPANRALQLPGEAINAVGLGVMHFFRNGTVTVTDAAITELLINQIAVGQIPVSPKTPFGCTGTYAQLPNDRITAVLTCNALTGQPGVTVTLAPFEFEGFVGEGNRSIGLSTVSGNTQTVTVAVGGTPVQQRERICLQSLTLGRL